VDLELGGEDAERQMPQVKHHLGQCRACREEYEALHDLRRMEDEGIPPSIEDLLP
jgi:predicted anti-sigma-YlaC factor YlaD